MRFFLTTLFFPCFRWFWIDLSNNKNVSDFLSQARWKNTIFALFRQKKFLHVSKDSELIWAKTNRKQFLGENFRLKSDFASLYLQPKFLRICEFFLQHAPKSNVFIACVGFSCKNTHPLTNHKHSPTAALLYANSDTKIINIKLELTQYFANFLTHLLLSSVKKWPMYNVTTF